MRRGDRSASFVETTSRDVKGSLCYAGLIFQKESEWQQWQMKQ